MGQQQLLLIVLGVIIVGIAIVVGINLFNANAESSAKDGVVSDCTNLAAMAQQFYKKPVAMGGGGNSFTKAHGATAVWSIPALLDTTGNGTYTAVPSDQSVVITGTPLTGSGYAWTVTTTVTPTTIASKVNP
jgi:hypothetical protein